MPVSLPNKYKALRKRKDDSLQSCLGHALNTSSYCGMVKKLESKNYFVHDGKLLHENP